DIDLVLLDADDKLEYIVEQAGSHGLTTRIPDAVQFARRHRVLLLQAPDGTEVDVTLGLLPVEHQVVENATLESIQANAQLRVATAEDLIILKLIASRPRDLEDARRLVQLHPDLDLVRIRSVIGGFADMLDSPEMLTRAEEILSGP
ncbi:MAG: hypothetical protein MH204_03935, partial [Fimbriimonadaceae bacterium]|nr:hypothetical protein [Fimbriimonadaceae bacterium]